MRSLRQLKTFYYFLRKDFTRTKKHQKAPKSTKKHKKHQKTPKSTKTQPSKSTKRKKANKNKNCA